MTKVTKTPLPGNTDARWNEPVVLKQSLTHMEYHAWLAVNPRFVERTIVGSGVNPKQGKTVPAAEQDAKLHCEDD